MSPRIVLLLKKGFSMDNVSSSRKLRFGWKRGSGSAGWSNDPLRSLARVWYWAG